MNRKFTFFTNILIVVLSFLIILFTCTGTFEMIDSLRSYTISEDSLVYTLQDGRYGTLVSYYHKNMAANVKPTETMEECYAIARYYEAAIDYKLAIQENDLELNQTIKEKMETASKEMGALSYAEKEINELLGIE